MTAVLALTDERRGLPAVVARPAIRTVPMVVDGEPNSDAVAGNVFSGYAAVYNQRTAIGNPLTFGFYEQIAPSAFSKTIQESDARFLIDHNPMYVVSRSSAGTLELSSDRTGLAVDSQLDPALSYVNDLVANVRNGNITGMSFGFQVINDHWDTEATRTADGNSIDVEVRTLYEVRLIEVSAVTFPAYAQTQAEVNSVAVALTRRGDYDAIERRAVYVPELRDLCGTPRPKAKKTREKRKNEGIVIEDAEERGAIAPHSTPTTTVPWDAGANVKRIPADAPASVLKAEFAWIDPDGDPTAKNSFRFPHHITSAAGVPGAADTVACSAGIANLNGGRTAPDIPDSDRQGVWAHLAAHLRDAKLTPPPLRPVGSGEKSSDDAVETTHTDLAPDSDAVGDTRDIDSTQVTEPADATHTATDTTPEGDGTAEPAASTQRFAPTVTDRMRVLRARYKLPA